MIKNKKLIDRFLRYVEIDTQSSDESQTQPTTKKQRDLARLLVSELEELGARVDFDEEFCYVYAKLPGNLPGADRGDVPALGFIAHMDTSPAVSGAGVKPRLIENYQGEDPILKVEDFPELRNHFGEDLIATDGTTLLGADDKAGVAEIMNMAEYFHEHPQAEHREIRIAFTPDEETGRGTEHFDGERFGAAQAYTVDGGKLGILEYECFNAAGAQVDFTGRSVHPGAGKDALVNACALAVEFAGLLPAYDTPEHTQGREGFFHLDQMGGDVEHAWLRYIIRDHDRAKFEERKAMLQDVAKFMNRRYGASNVHGINRRGEKLVQVQIQDQYYNMAEPMKDHMDLVDNAEDALRELGVTPCEMAIRGGTDGAMLSFRGIPCPNLCTGGYNYHSRFEYASVQEMEITAQMLIRLAGKV